ncbi:cysteine proteinase [Tilletiaria anomala UBC 951]|uniref:Ubiquitin carboxyl-terminal hydrolase n=1 Tax=Tilletiaria anomala (strain ATCC 24038 / CBS 436.72 / UBC 951) TaxID=1037660 RepID=A0A066WGM6_TILAU|nr:cysteine proteinase [Tilletiaria anomala UBC 951]KDN52941.1 cysteine proteinase [Tilletiaria anomala UBC 951]
MASMSVDEPSAVRWVPLESDPELFTAWAHKMGLQEGTFQYYDVFGLDDALLDMVPSPAEAVLLLFPVSKEYEEKRLEDDKDIDEAATAEATGDSLWFKQTIGNACGTMGLLHSLANSSARECIKADSPLAKLLEKATSLSPRDRAALLVESQELHQVHSDISAQGQTEAPSAEANVDLHFDCFVRDKKTGELIELDGRRKGPVHCGVQVPTQEALLKTAAKWIQESYMSLNPEELNFNLIALAPVQ